MPLLHTGDESNRKKLLMSRGWSRPFYEGLGRTVQQIRPASPKQSTDAPAFDTVGTGRSEPGRSSFPRSDDSAAKRDIVHFVATSDCSHDGHTKSASSRQF